MFYQDDPSQMNKDEEAKGWKLLLTNKKALIIISSFLLVVILITVWFITSYSKAKNKVVPVTSTAATPTTTAGVLPVETSTSTPVIATTTDLSELEKYSFSDFYQEPAPIPEFNFKDYALPLNVKIDALNYYDVSRKFNLDKGVSSLNANGFAVIDNPDSKNVTDFYSAYSWLSNKQVPLLITSDFLLHYHQNVIKQAFKDIEENIFYDNLWHISKSLYESSKNRYEARLAKIGNVNDQVLEGERLSTAYFAVALKLMEPDATQIDSTGKDATKFTNSEAANLSFTVLPYLKSDAGEEITLIKGARDVKKSPVLLYNRNYTDFIVPDEYRRSAKLYNFYLASTWLNSVFPLVTKDKTCPNCLLDKDDGRLNLIAATFITKDFSSDQQLKNRWALVYKLLSYSKGLRDDLSYRQYDEAMKTLFGKDYDPELLFAEGSKDSAKNLDKLRTKLLDLQFNSSLGALDKTKDRPRLGFKLLSDYYYPNSYIFDRLSGTGVGKYSGNKASSTNNTVCKNNITTRCNGSGFDVIGLITDKINSYAYWVENTNYTAYQEKILALKNELKALPIWHNNNFWSTLGTIKTLFENNNGQMQAYASTDLWKNRLADTAGAAWVDLQLPLEQLSSVGSTANTGLSNSISSSDNSYIEPNYALIQKLIADNEMVYGMFNVMGVNQQVSSVSISLKDENSKLRQFSDLIKKELNGETLSSDNQIFIDSVTKQYQLTKIPSNQLDLKLGDSHVYENIGLKFMALTYELGDGKYIAVGPVFSYQETRFNK